MPMLNVMCPITHRPFSTGIEVAENEKDCLPNIRQFSPCPCCKWVHGWTPDMAFFGDGEIVLLD